MRAHIPVIIVFAAGVVLIVAGVLLASEVLTVIGAATLIAGIVTGLVGRSGRSRG